MCFNVGFLYCEIFYVTGSWHGDLRRYKHKNLLVIKQGCGTGRYIELHVWPSHQHERAQRLYVVPSFTGESIPG